MEPAINAQNNSLLLQGGIEEAIKDCGHKDELQLYAIDHNTALCNECYFENQEHWGKTLTLK